MHPILYLVVQLTLIVIVLGFAQPRSPLRLAGLVIEAFCVARCIPLCMPYMKHTPWAALVGGYSVTYLYHYLDVAILSQWNFASKKPDSGLVRPTFKDSQRSAQVKRKGTQFDTNGDGFRSRLAFGVKIASSSRFVGTCYEVRNTPRPIALDRNSRKRYLWRTFAIVATSYLGLGVINAMNDPVIASKYLGLDKIPLFSRISDVTAEEFLIRFFTVLAAGIGLNCVQGGLYHLFGLVAVALHISHPNDWPPFYGSVGETHTLMNFWNVFWHQTNARKFSSIAHYTVHAVLYLPRGTLVARYLRIMVAFLSSGFMHFLDDLSSGVELRNSGAMRFFFMQGLGLVAESLAIEWFRSANIKVSRTFAKGVGFVWVSSYLTWTVPGYLYPMLWRANQGLDDSTVPFSVFGPPRERIRALGVLSFTGLVALVGGVGQP